MSLTPFRIRVDPARLALLDERLEITLWPNVPAGLDGHGIAVDRVRELVTYWRETFRWSGFAGSLDQFEHLIHDDGDFPLHLVRARAEQPTGLPIVLLHGWPDAFLRYRKLIPLLAKAGHDVVVPSLPGFAFSGQPTEPLTAATAAERVHSALAELGLTRYVLHGGDFGGIIADELAGSHPDEVAGLHLTDIPFPKQFTVDRGSLDAEERTFYEASDAWMEKAAYFTVQTVEPLTLAYGLTDSPVGLLAWIADKFDALSDEVDPEDVVGLTALTWLTGTAWSGLRLYADDHTEWDDSNLDDSDWDPEDAAGNWAQATTDAAAENDQHAGPAADGEKPRAAFSIFPRDIGVPPESLASRFYDVVQWNTHERGGHFAATERPGAVAHDLLQAASAFGP
ncbi:epoxide hydrolase [Dietzia sp. PP-33]|uniref:epoxide hydrolase family protein n=1 Tax=Dietzia sp. PP-33 TaxID=2957500 RepID=UPI0029A0829E|nr:epoxide hydrolase [Dietzia sp. PP-33]MDX2357729.1 epoxide hydrolase 1 [Dietzia sp. PP-33]